MALRMACVALAAGTVITGPAAARAVCNVSSTDLTFGLYTAGGRSPTDTVGTITVSCSSPTATTVSYTLSLTGGTQMDARSRRMSSHGRPLPYQLFLDPAQTMAWGDGGEGSHLAGASNIPLAPGIADRRNFLIYGRIAGRYPASSGNYQDSITIVLNY